MARHSQHIAIITNNREHIETIQELIAPQGWKLSASIGEPQPIMWLNQIAADVALIDLDSPQALSLITQSVEEVPQTPLIALVTTEWLATLQPVLQAGVKDFVVSPVNPHHLMTVIGRTIQSQAEQYSSVHRIHDFSEHKANEYGNIKNSGTQDREIASHLPEHGVVQLHTHSPSFVSDRGHKSPPQAVAFPPVIRSNKGAPTGYNGHMGGIPSQPQQGVPQNRAYPVSYDSTGRMEHNMQSNGYHTKPSSPPRQRVIAIVGLRGGVGRSTIAANLAVALQQRQKGDVILAEAHHGLSHLSLMLHLHPRNTLAGLEEIAEIDTDIVAGHLQAHSSGVKVLAAPAHLDELVELSGEKWAEILTLLPEIAPTVIVDTAMVADEALLEVLVQADDIVVVMTPDIASLRSATALTKTLYEESDVHANIHIVLNRSNIGGGLDERTVRKQLGHEVVVQLPDDTSLATYAMNRGVPFVNSHPRALLTKRINTLADQLFDHDSRNEMSQKPAKSMLPFMNILRAS
ncbi:MAG: hypothetical protein AAF702_46265 [Chloroflexota bacterium]